MRVWFWRKVARFSMRRLTALTGREWKVCYHITPQEAIERARRLNMGDELGGF